MIRTIVISSNELMHTYQSPEGSSWTLPLRGSIFNSVLVNFPLPLFEGFSQPCLEPTFSWELTPSVPWAPSPLPFCWESLAFAIILSEFPPLGPSPPFCWGLPPLAPLLSEFPSSVSRLLDLFLLDWTLAGLLLRKFPPSAAILLDWFVLEEMNCKWLSATMQKMT